MNKALKVSLIVNGVILLVGIVIYFYLYNKLGGLQDTATDKDYKIAFNDTSDVIFIKASSWGFGGNHYIFYEPTIYYEQKPDTLKVYTPSLSDVPARKNTNIKIIQVLINGPEEINKYKEYYKSLGLHKVSVYD
jgi:hypothetical protein